MRGAARGFVAVDSGCSREFVFVRCVVVDCTVLMSSNASAAGLERRRGRDGGRSQARWVVRGDRGLVKRTGGRVRREREVVLLAAVELLLVAGGVGGWCYCVRFESTAEWRYCDRCMYGCPVAAQSHFASAKKKSASKMPHMFGYRDKVLRGAPRSHVLVSTSRSQHRGGRRLRRVAASIQSLRFACRARRCARIEQSRVRRRTLLECEGRGGRGTFGM